MKRRWHEVIIQELSQAMDKLDDSQLDTLIEAMTRPGRRVLCVGVGRVLLSMKAWVKRLRHLDIDLNFVGAESEEPIGPGDLLLVASASGESLFPVAIARKAKQLGAEIIYIGCTIPSSASELADHVVRLAGRTKFSRPEDPVSVQPMSTLFEQQLYLLCDAITLEIMDRRGWDEAYVKSKHANLE